MKWGLLPWYSCPQSQSMHQRPRRCESGTHPRDLELVILRFERIRNRVSKTLGAGGFPPPRSTCIHCLVPCIYRASPRNISVLLHTGEYANEVRLYMVHWLTSPGRYAPTLRSLWLMLMPLPAVHAGYSPIARSLAGWLIGGLEHYETGHRDIT